MDKMILDHPTGLMENVQSTSNSVAIEDASYVSNVQQQLHNTGTLAAVLTFMAIIILFGSLGNILVIMAVSQTKKLQTASNLFVANLSLCDLLFVSLVLPVNMYTYLAGGWQFNINICRAVACLGYTLTGTTIITITAIAWNRYKLVVDGRMYHMIFRRRNLGLMLSATWLIPALFLQPAVFGIWGHFDFIPMLSSCNLDLDRSSQTFKIFLLIVRAAIPCGLIIYFYSSIYLTTRASRLRLEQRGNNLNNNNNNGKSNDDDSNSSLHSSSSGNSASEPLRSVSDHPNQQREMRLTKMMIAIFLVFVVSYFPCTISSAIDMSHTLSKTFHMFCQTSIFLGSAINPLLYGFMNSQFRTAYYNIIMCKLPVLQGRFGGSTFTAASSISKRKKPDKVGATEKVAKVMSVGSMAPYDTLSSKTQQQKTSTSRSSRFGKSRNLKTNNPRVKTAIFNSGSLALLKNERI